MHLKCLESNPKLQDCEDRDMVYALKEALASLYPPQVEVTSTGFLAKKYLYQDQRKMVIYNSYFKAETEAVLCNDYSAFYLVVTLYGDIIISPHDQKSILIRGNSVALVCLEKGSVKFPIDQGHFIFIEITLGLLMRWAKANRTGQELLRKYHMGELNNSFSCSPYMLYYVNTNIVEEFVQALNRNSYFSFADGLLGVFDNLIFLIHEAEVFRSMSCPEKSILAVRCAFYQQAFEIAMGMATEDEPYYLSLADARKLDVPTLFDKLDEIVEFEIAKFQSYVLFDIKRLSDGSYLLEEHSIDRAFMEDVEEEVIDSSIIERWKLNGHILFWEMMSASQEDRLPISLNLLYGEEGKYDEVLRDVEYLEEVANYGLSACKEDDCIPGSVDNFLFRLQHFPKLIPNCIYNLSIVKEGAGENEVIDPLFYFNLCKFPVVLFFLSKPNHRLFAIYGDFYYPGIVLHAEQKNIVDLRIFNACRYMLIYCHNIEFDPRECIQTIIDEFQVCFTYEKLWKRHLRDIRGKRLRTAHSFM